MEKEIISAAQAARLIRQGDTLIIGGSGGIGVAEKILAFINSLGTIKIIEMVRSGTLGISRGAESLQSKG